MEPWGPAHFALITMNAVILLVMLYLNGNL
jgi:hypothetical protein